MNEVRDLVTARYAEFKSRSKVASERKSEQLVAKQRLQALENELDELNRPTCEKSRKKVSNESSLVVKIIKDEKKRDGRICVLVLNLIRPTDEKYSDAIMSVLGVHARKTIIVQTRDMAIQLAHIFASQGISGMRFEILDEIENSKVQNSEKNQKLPMHCLRMIDAVRLVDPAAKAAIIRIFENWILCEKDHSYGSKIAKSVTNFNVATIDGCRFLNDGEINYAAHKKTGKSTWNEITKEDDTATASSDRIGTVRHQIRQLKEEISRENNDLKNISSELSTLETELRSYDTELKNLETRLVLEPEAPMKQYKESEVEEAMQQKAIYEKIEFELQQSMQGLTFESAKLYEILKCEPNIRKKLTQIESDIRFVLSFTPTIS
jgi:chromosome segregation ATPase